ncbi:MAG: hypothetical protein IT374_03665 [Polyangiaceae bacterium]|nr:hypothetical protein [Polyangiaceae bacterium]
MSPPEPARPRAVALGALHGELVGDFAREGVDGDLDALLAEAPRAVGVAARGEEALFRASAAMERGCPRVVVRRGAIRADWLEELAHRAATFGALLYEHDDASGYRRAAPRGRSRAQLGGPAAPFGAWLERRAASAAALPVDDPTLGVPGDLEELAFTAGHKPVLYLVKPADEAARLLARHPGAHAATRAEAVAIDPATGARRYGEGRDSTHVFLSASRADAERAAALWERGSSAHARELGALLGYPPCCVAAFEALAARGDNAALVWITERRTRALSASFAPPLNVVLRRVVPFTPCTFSCRLAVARAEGVLDALDAGVASSLLASLSRAVLYLDEARSIVLEGARARGDELAYERAALVRDDGSVEAGVARAKLGAWLPPGGLLRLVGRGVELDGEEVGALLPFG